MRSGSLDPLRRLMWLVALLVPWSEADPGLRLTVRLTDETLPDQSGVYVVSGGSVRHSDAGCGPEEPDLYVTPDVLAAMMFSSNPLAAVTGLPGGRPHFSLMLD